MQSVHDDIYKALADPHRRQILAIVCDGPRQAGELGRLVGLAPNAVSFHLKWLRAVNLLVVRRKGRCLWYELVPETMAAWLTDAQGMFGSLRMSTSVSDQSMSSSSFDMDELDVQESRRRPIRASEPLPSVSADETIADILPDTLL